jgi:predicted O-linked N-acetylglucosamine transferase (SPINDLY family)
MIDLNALIYLDWITVHCVFCVQITPKVLQVWARILCAVPNSRLVVKCKPFCCDSIRQKFLTTLEELGLEPLRVDLLPLIHLNHDHMQAYSLMDIR